MTNAMITPVILSGGAGTRLWPLSTPDRPKQFLPLAGPETMFAATLARVANEARFTAPIIVGAARHEALLVAEAPEGATIILEPCARNTAPAIALAALAADAQALLLVMPSDHVIANVQAFLAAVDQAEVLARDGWLVTFGIAPTGPETGYGYIARGNPLAGGFKVARFVEKPPLEGAQAMLADGGYDWNAGIFLFRAEAFIHALGTHAGPMLDAAIRSYCEGKVRGAFFTPDANAFAACPSDSIDYAVMEKSDRVAVVPVSCGWSDVGSWDALADLAAPDAAGNIIIGDGIALDGSGNYIRSDGLRISAAGVSGMIIVASGQDVMILPRGASQQVKDLQGRRS